MDFRTQRSSNEPLVSIGVLSYNYAQYIVNTLNSIFKQSYQHIELFIVDDYSLDNSVEVIEQWISGREIKVDLILHTTNRGRNVAINSILKKATGKYIIFFASDDEMKDRRIEEQVKLMESVGDEYAVCYSDAELMNERGEFRGLYSTLLRTPFLSENVFREFYYKKFFIAAPTIMFRKSIYDLVGLYDSRLFTEDYDMWMRILPISKVIYCEYVGTKYRVKEDKQNTNAGHVHELEWYHKDRIIIYIKLLKLLKQLNKWPDIQQAVSKKISFHLIALKTKQSPHFWRMIKLLFANSFYNVPLVKLLRLSLKHHVKGIRKLPLQNTFNIPD